jgi:hypothetical protein
MHQLTRSKKYIQKKFLLAFGILALVASMSSTSRAEDDPLAQCIHGCQETDALLQTIDPAFAQERRKMCSDFCVENYDGGGFGQMAVGPGGNAAGGCSKGICVYKVPSRLTEVITPKVNNN